MFYIRFNDENLQEAFCKTIQDQIQGYVYYEAPAEFNPTQHKASLVNGEVVYEAIEAKAVPTATELAKKQIMSIYSKHESNGKDYFDEMRADLVLAHKQAIYTFEQIIEIDNKMKEVKALLRSGDWASALDIANKITPAGALTQDYLTKVQTDINTYIQNNYS